MGKTGKYKFLRRLFNPSFSIVGLDIGSGFIKAAEVSFAGKKPLLKSFGIISIPGSIIKEGRIADIQALPTLLQKLWVDSALVCYDVIAGIDARMVFAREISLPAMSRDELKSAVKWDMSNYVPYEDNSYYYDFDIIEADLATVEEPGSQCRVFLAAAPVKTVDDISRALEEAKCKVWAVDVEALAIAAAAGCAADGVNVVVDIGCFCSQIIIFSRDVPALTRIIPWGGQKFTELIAHEYGYTFEQAESLKLCRTEDASDTKLDNATLDNATLDNATLDNAALDNAALDNAKLWLKESRLDEKFGHLSMELAGEISRTADYFLRNRQEHVKNIYLTGGGANFKNLPANLAAELGGIPVSLLNPLDKLDISPDIDKNHLNKLAPQLTVAVGLALRGGQYDSD